MDQSHADILRFLNKSSKVTDQIVEQEKANCSKDQRTLYSDIHDVVDSKILEERTDKLTARQTRLEAIVKDRYRIINYLAVDRSGESSLIAVDNCDQPKVVESFQQIGRILEEAEQLQTNLKFCHSSVEPVQKLEVTLDTAYQLSNKIHFHCDCVDKFGAKFATSYDQLLSSNCKNDSV